MILCRLCHCFKDFLIKEVFLFLYFFSFLSFTKICLNNINNTVTEDLQALPVHSIYGQQGSKYSYTGEKMLQGLQSPYPTPAVLIQTGTKLGLY